METQINNNNQLASYTRTVLKIIIIKTRLADEIKMKDEKRREFVLEIVDWHLYRDYKTWEAQQLLSLFF